MRLFNMRDTIDRSRFNPRDQRIAAVLHDWDPIGVFEAPIWSRDPTEYDDLVGPLSVVLGRAATPAQVRDELDEAMTKDYGMPGLNLDGIAEKLIAAWEDVRK
jgi:hypothetical protein